MLWFFNIKISWSVISKSRNQSCISPRQDSSFVSLITYSSDSMVWYRVVPSLGSPCCRWAVYLIPDLLSVIKTTPANSNSEFLIDSIQLYWLTRTITGVVLHIWLRQSTYSRSWGVAAGFMVLESWLQYHQLNRKGCRQREQNNTST